jgi:hypothetical protein
VDKRLDESPEDFPFSTEDDKKHRLVVIPWAPAIEIIEVLNDTFQQNFRVVGSDRCLHLAKKPFLAILLPLRIEPLNHTVRAKKQKVACI